MYTHIYAKPIICLTFTGDFHFDTTAQLSGHFMVDVYDHAYAEAHAGVIGFKVDIVKALICYRGHVEYDLNVLKARLHS